MRTGSISRNPKYMNSPIYALPEFKEQVALKVPGKNRKAPQNHTVFNSSLYRTTIDYPVKVVQERLQHNRFEIVPETVVKCYHPQGQQQIFAGQKRVHIKPDPTFKEKLYLHQTG